MCDFRCKPSFAQKPIILYSFGDDFLLVMCLSIGMALFLAVFMCQIVEDRNAGTKRLQILSGLHCSIFWTANFCHDFTLYTMATCLVQFIWWMNGVTLLSGNGVWRHVAILFVLYGWSVLPFMYILTFMFHTAAGAITVLSTFGIFLGKKFF